MKFVKRFYAVIVTIALVIVVVLDRWDTTAEHLGIPPPREVVRVVVERVVGSEAPITFFNPEVDSAVGNAAIVGPTTPLSSYCAESVTISAEPIFDQSQVPPADSLAFPARRPTFVLPDAQITLEDLTIGPSERQDRSVHLSFVLENSGAEDDVFLDNVEIETLRRDPVDVASLSLTATWRREPSLPLSGPGRLRLTAPLPEESMRSRANLIDTGSEELNFGLKNEEQVLVDIQLPLVQPGTYSLVILVFAFDSNRERFEQRGPSFNFGWTTLTSGTFGQEGLVRLHSSDCKAND